MKIERSEASLQFNLVKRERSEASLQFNLVKRERKPHLRTKECPIPNGLEKTRKETIGSILRISALVFMELHVMKLHRSLGLKSAGVISQIMVFTLAKRAQFTARLAAHLNILASEPARYLTESTNCPFSVFLTVFAKCVG